MAATISRRCRSQGKLIGVVLLGFSMLGPVAAPRLAEAAPTYQWYGFSAYASTSERNAISYFLRGGGQCYWLSFDGRSWSNRGCYRYVNRTFYFQDATTGCMKNRLLGYGSDGWWYIYDFGSWVRVDSWGSLQDTLARAAWWPWNIGGTVILMPGDDDNCDETAFATGRCLSNYLVNNLTCALPN